MQDRFVVLPTVEHTDDGNLFGVYVKGDHHAFLVVGDAQAGPHIVAPGAAMSGEAAAAM